MENESKSETALLSLSDVASELGVGRTRVYELAATGQLPTLRVGRLIRVRPADLARYIASLAGENELASTR